MNIKEERFEIKPIPLLNEITNIVAFGVARDCLVLTSLSNMLYKVSYCDEDKGIEAYKIPITEKGEGDNNFQIFPDLIGNHILIKHHGTMFYCNSRVAIIKELISLSKINVTSIGWDNTNTNLTSTDKIIIGDDKTILYECTVSLEKDNKVKEKLVPLLKLNKEESTSNLDSIDPIYGLYLSVNEAFNYVLAVTCNRMYQFAGESIKSIFDNLSNNLSLLELSCITFPWTEQSSFSSIQLLYDDKMEIVSLGWQCIAGFCLSTFKDKSTNAFIDNFLITSYEMRKQGQKIKRMPIAVAHSSNHIFYLYNDNLSAVNKTTSNIVYKYEAAFKDILFDNYKNTILIRTNEKLYQLPLQEEKKFLWQDYIEIGEYDNALDFSRRTNFKHLKEVYKIVADISLENNDHLRSAEEYAYSNESFEMISFKLSHTNQNPALKEYLSWLLDIRIPDDKKLAKCLVGTLLVELLINVINNIKHSDHLSNELGKLMTYLNQNKNYLEKSTIYELLLQAGLIDQYLEFAENIEDYETVVLHYINADKTTLALQKMDYYITKFDHSFSSIFNKYTQLFIKENVKGTIDILKKVSLKFKIDSNQLICAMPYIDDTQVDNMCEYLQSLIEDSYSKDKIVHNLYLYFLSKTADLSLKSACIEYLQKQLEHYINIKDIAPDVSEEIPFEIEYGLKVFTEAKYYSAQALVLSMKDKYREAVKLALNKKELKIAMFIAESIFNTKLKKELWLDIFKDQIKTAEDSLIQNGNKGQDNGNEEVQSALDLIKKSGVLKIEDVLLHMVDNIKIKEFKYQIAECIEGYETNLKKIKQDISSYNNTAENIKTDLALVKKKAIDVQFSCCQCDICQRDIKLEMIIIFNCGHMFDSKCMMGVITKLAKFLPSAKEKNKRIAKFKQEIKEIENKKEIKPQPIDETKKFLKKLTIELRAPTLQNEKNNIRVPLSVEEERRVEELKSKINKILIEECVKCGNMIIESIQYPFEGNESSWMLG